MKMLFCAVMLVIGTSFSVQAVPMIEYKCYLDTSKGKEIGFYRWNDDEHIKEKVAALVASKRQDYKGKTYYVRRALECVPLTEQFTSKAAIKLDSRTPR